MVGQLFSFRRLTLLFLTITLLQTAHAQSGKFGFDKVLKETPDVVTSFAIPYTAENLAFLSGQKVTLKYITKNWIYISCTPEWIYEKKLNKNISDFHFENYKGVPLADSARTKHYVNPVHQGIGGLDASYTGEGVIIGYVDQGIDFTHPDFRNPDGTSRVIRYWDHTTSSGGPASPYGYGIVWGEDAINNGTCTSSETGTAHGTTVAGMGSGNAGANGQNRGMAPKSKIIAVESTFGLSNWTLSIADACDYIFKVADTLGMAAVVNLSLGTYLGSHDGDDVAAEAIETLLDAKPGRVVVCAAGNSGAQGKYHVHEDVVFDTTFVWIQNNASGTAAFGPNHIYFDLWSDDTDATFQYAFGADNPGPNYSLRGSTVFRNAMTNVGSFILDTIRNSNGQRIATIEIYPEMVGNNFHMEVYFSNIDSTAYYYRFMTKGSGSYDMWSGAWMGLNNFVTAIPDVATYPAIADYVMPDTLQTIVSAWACSEKIITVGNLRNRYGFTNKNNSFYTPGDGISPGKLSLNSSKGPSRKNVVKPDVSACGDMSLTAAPLWLLTNPGYNNIIDINGWHALNGGTSMASPLVAGLAALYLERCPEATYASFKNDLINTAFSDQFTGTTPNYAYGYGKPHALDMMLTTMFTANITGDLEKCGDPIPLTCNSSTAIDHVVWNTGFVGNPLMADTGGNYTAMAYDTKGCRAIADTHTVVQLEVLPILPILQSGNVLATLSFTNYQWTLDGVDIPGATSQTLTINPPYGTYTCYCVSSDGCISETPPFTVSAGIEELAVTNYVYPNPATDYFLIDPSMQFKNVELFDARGSLISLEKNSDGSFSVKHLPVGIYQVVITTDSQKITSKIAKL